MVSVDNARTVRYLPQLRGRTGWGPVEVLQWSVKGWQPAGHVDYGVRMGKELSHGVVNTHDFAQTHAKEISTLVARIEEFLPATPETLARWFEEIATQAQVELLTPVYSEADTRWYGYDPNVWAASSPPLPDIPPDAFVVYLSRSIRSAHMCPSLWHMVCMVEHYFSQYPMYRSVWTDEHTRRLVHADTAPLGPNTPLGLDLGGFKRVTTPLYAYMPSIFPQQPPPVWLTPHLPELVSKMVVQRQAHTRAPLERPLRDIAFWAMHGQSVDTLRGALDPQDELGLLEWATVEAWQQQGFLQWVDSGVNTRLLKAFDSCFGWRLWLWMKEHHLPVTGSAPRWLDWAPAMTREDFSRCMDLADTKEALSSAAVKLLVEGPKTHVPWMTAEERSLLELSDYSSEVFRRMLCSSTEPIGIAPVGFD